jgi:superfamily I DNA/RNA helicase
MSEIQVAISQDFFNAFADIPRTKQKKVQEFVSKFRNNPQATGINYEKINDAANPGYRSVRIDQEYRGIVLKPETGNVYLLMWVDKHDDAYNWARRHKCQINPETGTLQLYEVVVGAPAAEPTAVAQEAPALLTLRDREFLRLGVPEELLTKVKALISMAELEAIKAQLPVEAFEALSFLADGIPLDEVMQEYAVPDGVAIDLEDIAVALARVPTQRRFTVVTDELKLKQMLEAPLSQWRVFLHPTQRRLVERSWNGPVRVLGGAGTGKTVVAMHRARYLVKQVLKPGEKLLLTTFTRNLASDIEFNLRKICTPEQMKQIEVANIDAWVMRFLKREKQNVRIVYSDMDDYGRCWQKALVLQDGSLELPDSFYQDEWERVILPQRVLSQMDYFKASRIGRGVPLSRQQRAKVWPVFEEMRLQMHQANIVTLPDATFAARDLLTQKTPPYRAVIVDEAQDFGEETLRLLRGLVDEQTEDLMIVGDGHQRIYGRKSSLGKCGINIRGRGRKLRINYRTTEQIRRFATAILEGVNIDDMDEGADSTAGYRSLVNGDSPVLKEFDSDGDEAAWIADEVERLLQQGLEPQDICLVGRTAMQIKPVSRELVNRGHSIHNISREATDDSQTPGVRLANMHRVKGLEFKVVFLVGIRDGIAPLEYALNKSDDPVEKRAAEISERALLHVAATRAVRGLYVTWSGDKSGFIS